VYSPAGSYIVDCEEIEKQWPDQAGDLILDIHPTGEPGIFEADFEFRVLEGAMIIGADEKSLEQYCAQLDREVTSASESEDTDEREPAGSKKRAAGAASPPPPSSSRGRGRPPKKQKVGAAGQPRTYPLRLKCRETGMGEIYAKEEEGSIKFKDGKMASFVGEADLPCVGRGTRFTARKISDTPAPAAHQWADFSKQAYEYARVHRWH
jgi:hypothetical protein